MGFGDLLKGASNGHFTSSGQDDFVENPNGFGFAKFFKPKPPALQANQTLPTYNDPGASYDRAALEFSTLPKLPSLPAPSFPQPTADAYRQLKGDSTLDDAMRAVHGDAIPQLGPVNFSTPDMQAKIARGEVLGPLNDNRSFLQKAIGGIKDFGHLIDEAGNYIGQGIGKSGVNDILDGVLRKSGGLNGTIQSVSDTNKTLQDARWFSPSTASNLETVGKVGGELYPFALGSPLVGAGKKLTLSAVEKLTPKLAQNLASKGLLDLTGLAGGEALLGGAVSGGLEALKGAANPDKFNLKDAALNVGLNTALGAALGPAAEVGFAGVSQLGRNILGYLGKRAEDVIPQFPASDVGKFSELQIPKPIQAPSKLTTIDPKAKALQDYENGVQKVQDYIKHNDILAAYPQGTTIQQALRDIKTNTGVDLEALAARLDTPSKPLSSQLQSAAETSRLGRVAGAFEPKPFNLLPAQLPKASGAPLQPLNPFPVNAIPIKPPAIGGKALNAEPLNIPAKSQAVAPEVAATMKGNWFTNLFGNQGVGVSAVSSTKRISDAPLTTTDQIVKNGIKTDVQGVKDTIAAQARAAYQNFVDRLEPLKRISADTYESAMDTARGNNIANTITRDKFVTPEGQVVGEGLQGIFKKVARGQDKSFVDYLVLRHAKTRMERGERVYADNLGMTPETVQARIDMYNSRHPEFENIAKEWDTFNDNVLKYYGVDGDLMTPELYNALREKNPYYAGMRRQFTRSEKPGRNFLAKTTSSSFSGQKAPLKEVSPTGSVRNIIDPRKTAVETVGAFVNASLRNRVMVSMVDAIKRNPEAFNGIAEIVQKPKSTTDLRQLLLDGGPDDFAEALNVDFQNLFKTTKLDGQNIVRAMVKGEPVHIQVHDPEVVKTLIGLGPQASNIMIDALTAASNATKRGATGLLAPVFAVKGATMDLVQSAIQSKNPAKQAAYTVYSIFSGIGDRLQIPGLKNLAEEFRRAGGEYSAALKSDRKLNTQISNMTRHPLLSPQSIGKGAVNLAKLPFKALEEIGNIAENAPRMAAYKLEMERLGNAKTPENVRQAMSQARESTTNFSRKGAFSHDIESLVPYNNAAIQGTQRVISGLRHNTVRTVASIGVLSVLPKLYEYAQFHDDPEYQNLPARERMRFLIVNKNSDGTFTKIPMEPAYNSFGEMTIEALRHFKDNDPTAFKDTMDALANAWLPPAVTGALQGITQGGGPDKSIAGALNSTVAAPLVAVTANQSFTGAPIVSKSVADRSPQYQYDEKTSAVAKKFGELTGMSPMKADYLIRAYGGDPARLLLPLTSDSGQGNTKNTLLKNFVVDPAYSNTLTNDFYNAKQKLDSAYRDNKELNVPFPSWYDEGLRKQLDSQAQDSLSKRISTLTVQKAQINADKNLSPEQKTEKTRAIQVEMIQIYKDINSRLQKAGIQGR